MQKIKHLPYQTNFSSSIHLLKTNPIPAVVILPSQCIFTWLVRYRMKFFVVILAACSMKDDYVVSCLLAPFLFLVLQWVSFSSLPIWKCLKGFALIWYQVIWLLLHEQFVSDPCSTHSQFSWAVSHLRFQCSFCYFYKADLNRVYFRLLLSSHFLLRFFNTLELVLSHF